MSAILLVHGAYQGGWIWRFVAERLRDAGHQVYAPSLDGCAERRHLLRPGIDTESHGEELAGLLYYEDLRDVVLVGTSSGGMAMAAAAERARDRVGRLVFADALALFDGETIFDVVDPPAGIRTDLGIGYARDAAQTRMFANLAPELAAWAADRVTLHPIDVFAQPVRLPTFWQQRWDASVIHCTRAPNPGESHLRRCAEKLDARWYSIETGHYPMLSTPDELARLIVEG